MKKITLFLMLMITLGACKSYRDLPTVKEVDLVRYSGRWYEIARLPNRFEKDLVCVSATYRLKSNGKIEVINQGVTPEGEVKRSKGTAWRSDEQYPGRLKVSFFWPFAGNYYIIDLGKGESYDYALVGSPSRKYLWILARTKSIEEKLYHQLLAKAQNLGFDIQPMIRTRQSCKASFYE
jgi:lipocalin